LDPRGTGLEGSGEDCSTNRFMICTDTVAQMVEALRYKLEGRGLD
jgi:hypothetical protein